MNDQLTVLRVATSSIFIVSGLGHLIRPDKILSQLGKNFVSELVQTLPMIDLLIRLSGVPLLVFGVIFLLNKSMKLTSMALLLMTIGITISTHMGADSIGPLFKNIVIMAALYTFYAKEKTLKY